MSDKNIKKDNKMAMGKEGPPHARVYEKAKDFKGSLKRLIGYLKPHKRNLIVVFIFAILSSTFTIAAPKVSSKAMNKLQDSYMADNMINSLEEAQEEADESIIDEFGNSQDEAIDGIINNMAKTQDEILTSISSQSTNGDTNNSQILDEDTLKSMQVILSLQKIDSLDSKEEKIDTVLILIENLKNLPSTEDSESEINSDDLDVISEFLTMDKINEVETLEEKKTAAINFIEILDKMPEFDNGESVDKDSLNSIKTLLELPLIKNLESGKEKAEVCNSFIELGDDLKESAKDNGLEFESGDNSLNYTDSQIEGVIEAVEETNGEYDFKYIGMIVLVLIGMYIISSIFQLIMGLVMSGVAQKTVRDMRTEVNNKLNKVPLKYYDAHPHGDILSRVSNDIDTISTTLQQSLTQVITAVILIIGYIIMMFTINWILSVIVILTLPLYMIATTKIAKRSQRYFASQQKELGNLSGHVEEMYTGHKIVKAFGHENDSIKDFEKINDDLYDAGWRAQFVSGIMHPVMNFISNLSYVMICIVGGIWITKDLLKVGDIVAFIQYSRSFNMPIIQTANIANILQSTVACAERVFELLDEEEEIPEAKNPILPKTVNGEVVFKNVSFSYKKDEPLIENMNIEVEKGSTIAIIGPTGAGKTTLVNLLMRFYEINSGSILIDDVDIRDIKRNDLRKMFGMVLQDTWLFNGSISDNIAYGKENATKEEIENAAKAAHADHFIRTLPDGYDTILNEEGTNISQGQKQLLTIARSILANPPILILDEATSSVDTRTEVLIQNAIDNLMENRTSFVIAHRLSTIREAKMILVMNQGSIIEMGNHMDLIKQNGFYAELYNSQFTSKNNESQVV
jgi:ATP-binding cassette subfamily B protein